jgi:hypothetical protein
MKDNAECESKELYAEQVVLYKIERNNTRERDH